MQYFIFRHKIATNVWLSKPISQFIHKHYNNFFSFDDVKINYDNGQVEVSKILSAVFNALLPNPIFRKVMAFYDWLSIPLRNSGIPNGASVKKPIALFVIPALFRADIILF